MAEGKLRSASQLTVHTGNILKHKDKPIRFNASPEEEVESGLKHTLQKWNETSDNSSINSNHIAMNSIHVHDSDCCSRLDGNSVEDLTITLKVFINCGNDKDHISHVLDAVRDCLGTDVTHKLLIAKPECMEVDSECFRFIWSNVERLAKNGKVVALGVSDFDTASLIRLHELAEVKPSMTQVNLATCCVVPPEMTEFAQANDIQILTHNDPQQLVTQERLQNVLRNVFCEDDIQGWKPCWCARYSVLIKQRGILKSKGYIVKACRKLTT